MTSEQIARAKEEPAYALPADAILPGSGGIKSPLSCLTQARYGIAWGALGAAMACYAEALSYAKQRGGE